MAQAQLTNLTWKLSPDNLLRMLHDMRGRSDFTDVTLVCDDDALVEAHKVVLGALSPVFRKMLASNHLLYPGSHPMIYLRGVKHQDMEAILRYIYLGETTVHQDRIKNVLDAAKEFGIKELRNNNNEDLQSPKISIPNPKASPKRATLSLVSSWAYNWKQEKDFPFEGNEKCISLHQNSQAAGSRQQADVHP